MTVSLKQIKKPIEKELQAFESHFRDSMKSNVPLLDKITYYIVQRKGKQLRPMFVFLTAKMVGDINPSTFTAASLVELLHTATLVHDDVVDDAYERRGFFSINALWKNKIAVLVGDYLLSRGLLLALDNKQYRLLHILSDAVREMSEGELLQIEKARKLDIKEEIYFEIIRQKTASLISSACASGAASVTEDEEVIKLLKSFGEKIGIAFQIKDDLFDFGDQNVGKPRGIDIKEKKMTLPLIKALNDASRSKKNHIKYLIKNKNKDDKSVKEVIDFVKSSNGIQYAEEKMKAFKSEALAILNDFNDCESKRALLHLVDFVIDRTR